VSGSTIGRNLYVISALFVLALAVTVGAIMRAVKSPAIPVDIPPRFRAAFVIFLGEVAAVLAAALGAVDWSALLSPAQAAPLAMIGHALVIELMRGGRELGVSRLDHMARPQVPPYASDASRPPRT